MTSQRSRRSVKVIIGRALPRGVVGIEFHYKYFSDAKMGKTLIGGNINIDADFMLWTNAQHSDSDKDRQARETRQRDIISDIDCRNYKM